VGLTPVGQCYGMSYYVFGHPPAAAASGLARRAVRAVQAVLEEAREGGGECPGEMVACAFDGGVECLDISSELGMSLFRTVQYRGGRKLMTRIMWRMRQQRQRRRLYHPSWRRSPRRHLFPRDMSRMAV
jgi:hypothetical protein